MTAQPTNALRTGRYASSYAKTAFSRDTFIALVCLRPLDAILCGRFRGHSGVQHDFKVGVFGTMKPNEDILNAFHQLADREKLELKRVLDEYEAACHLSQGPRPDRSVHWTTKALDLEDDLRKRLGLD